MKSLVAYIELVPRRQIVKRVLLDGIEPTLFLTGMSKLWSWLIFVNTVETHSN